MPFDRNDFRTTCTPNLHKSSLQTPRPAKHKAAILLLDKCGVFLSFA